jgi:uncharacterized protein YjdB
MKKIFVLLLLSFCWANNAVLAQSVSFFFTGAVQTYTVPCGVTSISVDLAGAQGGIAPGFAAGNKGGRLQATVAVTPGQILYIYVGQQPPEPSTCGSGTAGGSNSGGGADGGAGSSLGCSGAGGGGSTDIRTISGNTADALNSRLAVAGGGGGGSSDCGSSSGGVGGGLTGGDGTSGCGISSIYAGQGGTSSAGGAAATSGGFGGGLGVGGAGEPFQAGGGGGGGYYGGGGGYQGGGGGGSSYYGAASGATTTPGYRFGNGYVIITAPSPISGPDSVCIGATASLSSSPSGGIWSSSNTSIATVDSTGMVLGVAGGTTIISYSLGAGCIYTLTMTVNPVTPSAISGPSCSCVGTGYTYFSSPSGGTWSSSDTAVAKIDTVYGSSSSLVLATGPGTTTISYTMSGSCGVAATTLVVTIYPALFAGTISGSSVVSPGDTTTLTASVAGGVWTSSDPSVATVDSSGIVTGVAPGYFDIYYFISGPCAACGNAVTIWHMTVNPCPPIAPIEGPAAVCAGSLITLTDVTGGGTWQSNNATATIDSTTGIVTGVDLGTSIISYTLISTGCRVTRIITVNFPPGAGAISGITALSVDSTITLDDPVLGGKWSSSNMSVASVDSLTGVVTGISAGPAIISYTVTNSCGSAYTTFSVTVIECTVSPISGDTTVCVGSTTSLSDATGGGTWLSSDPSVAAVGSTGMVYGVAVGTATISYTLGAAGCVSTVTMTVNPTTPSAISGPTCRCVGLGESLSSSPSGGTWSSSDTGVASVSSGFVVGIAPGTTTISYTISGACGMAASTLVVTVYPAPVVVTISGASILYTGTTTTLTTTGTGGYWASSDTSVAKVNSFGVVSTIAPGFVFITYNVPHPCCGNFGPPLGLTVYPCPASAIGGTATVCPGSQTTLTEDTPGGTWQSDNANATVGSSTGIVTGVNAGTSIISYTLILTGCSVTKIVTVDPLPSAGAISGPAVVFVASAITLIDPAPGGTWSSSNLSVATVGSATGVVTGVSAGTVIISYTATNSCGSTYATYSVTVTTGCAVSPISGTPGICVGSTIPFSDATPGGTWISSSTSIATIDAASGIVTGVAAGTATISYTLAGCYVTSIVTVQYEPSATITVTPANTTYTGGSANTIYLGYGPQSATLTANSSGGSGFTYSWAPGTALSCTDCANPVFAPTAAGTYVYTVTVTNSNGCIATATVTMCVIDARDAEHSNKVIICHVPPGNPSNPLTLSISISAVPTHIGSHAGDRLGSCSSECGAAAKTAPQDAQTVNDGEFSMLVYPNPFNTEIHVDIEGKAGTTASIAIFDMTGRIIEYKADQSIDSSIIVGQHLPPGVYILEVNQNGIFKKVKVTKL